MKYLKNIFYLRSLQASLRFEFKHALHVVKPLNPIISCKRCLYLRTLQTLSPLCLHPLQQKYSVSSISTLIYPQAQHLLSLQVHCILKIITHKTVSYCTKKIKRRVKTLENRKSFYKNVFACYNVIYLTFIIRISSKDQYNFNMSLYEQWYNSLTIWATSICNYMYKHKDKKYWLIIFEVKKK